jgi:hypothetical protein
VAGLPQPFVVRLESAPATTRPPEPAWGEVTKHLRETAKWIVGGVIATAGGVIAGSSITRIGSLDPREDMLRLILVAAGAGVGFVAIGILFRKALDVFRVPAASLLEISRAEPKSEWGPLHQALEAQFDLAGKAGGLRQMVADDRAEDEDLLTAMQAMAPYLHVRAKFDAMTNALPGAVLAAAIGFGLFAWAANPPERKTPPARAPALLVNWP